MAEPLEVSDALFEILEGGRYAIKVHAAGAGFVTRDTSPVAYVGDQWVEALRTSPGGDGFSGYLVEMPPNGAELRVGWPGEPLVKTGISFKQGEA